ncbi:Spaetzle [Halocaridina rubra]|uniref:Spaetzle n=1 Tax=Halocaridina rubra TaxID=373956 RepID=A0AAN9AFT8_HALRR
MKTMVMKMVSFLLVGSTWASSTSHVSISLGDSSVSYKSNHVPAPHYHSPPAYHPAPAYHPEPVYPVHPKPKYPAHPEPKYPAHPEPKYPAHPEPKYPARPPPAYHPEPAYHPKPVYHPEPSYKPHEPEIPSCSELTNATYCLEDEEYPEYDIKHAIQYHLDDFNHLYADVADLDTELSVERPDTLEEETYLCPSEIAYIRPLRALNTDGKWRVIVNEIKLHYKTFTQTARVEDCLTSGEECPKVPMCYESKCLQKSIYHRFLVYDPYDKYFPFAIETFMLPASCACLLGAYTIDH